MEKIKLTVSGQYGNFQTVAEYWDCECGQDYIKHKATEPVCSECGTSHDEQPDSRLNEVAQLATHKNTEEFFMYSLFPSQDIFTGEEIWISPKDLRDFNFEVLYHDIEDVPADMRQKIHPDVCCEYWICKSPKYKNPITLVSVDLHDLEALQNGEEIG